MTSTKSNNDNEVKNILGVWRGNSYIFNFLQSYLDDYSESMTSLISHIEGMQDRFDEFNNVPISKTGTNLQEIAEAISANPIMVFKLLRRFAIDLSGIQTDIDNTDHHLGMAFNKING